MRAHLRSIVLASAALFALPVAAAHAGQYTLVLVDTGDKICVNRPAPTHKEAFRNCMAAIGVFVPAADAITTVQPVCQSTHKVVLLGATNPRWVYDRRFTSRTRPGCS